MKRRQVVCGLSSGLFAIGSRPAWAKPRLKYDNWKAITYAKTYACKQENACGVFLNEPNKTDCAHFIAHCLDAGGLRIENSNPQKKFCKSGLAVENPVLVDKLKQLATQYENVKAISLTDAIVGDIGFLKIERPRHAFMVCEPWPGELLTTPKVYAHSTARCCEPMDAGFRQWFSDAFRLEDG